MEYYGNSNEMGGALIAKVELRLNQGVSGFAWLKEVVRGVEAFPTPYRLPKSAKGVKFCRGGPGGALIDRTLPSNGDTSVTSTLSTNFPTVMKKGY